MKKNMKVFKCECGREQSYAPPNEPGGITKVEAEFVGWLLIKGNWICPICIHNQTCLSHQSDKPIKDNV